MQQMKRRLILFFSVCFFNCDILTAPQLVVLMFFFFFCCPPASTYIYKGSSYWRFDNRRTEADRGYPRSILKDFMGCVGVPDPDPETKRNPGTEPVRPPRPTEPVRGPDRELRPGSTEDDPDQEVNVVVTVTDSKSKVMTLVMVTAPLLLILCILVLVYTILRTLQNKEPPRALVHCKRSLQDWV